MDFSITNYKKYQPVKVINITETGTKAIYTFVGYVSENVQRVLQNPQELSNKDEQILLKEYGTNWKKILGFPKSKLIERKRGSSQFSTISTSDEFDSDSLFDTLDSQLESIPDVQEKIQETIERRTGLNFVFDYINNNDSIETVKSKIYAYTNIPIISQHIFYKRDNPIIKGEIETVILDYKVIDLYNKFRIIPIDILNARETTTVQVGDVPIDKNFADNVKRYLIRSTLLTLLADFEGFDNEIFLADINSFIPSITRVFAQNIEEVYRGYILKYFPSIPFNLIKPVLNNTYQSPLQPNTIKRDTLATQKQINIIKELELKGKKLNIQVSNVIININYPQEINITDFKTSKTELLILRNVFEVLNTSQEMPYIRLVTKNKTQSKVDKEFYNNNPALVRRNWMSSQDSAGLIIKLRLSNNPKDPRYSKFISIIIYSDGKMDIRVSFPIQLQISNEKVVSDVIDNIQNLVDKINKFKPEVFVRPVSELQILSVKIASISSIFYPELLTEMFPNDYSMLQCFSKAFNSYIIPDHEVQRGNMAVAFRYINKTFTSSEKIKKATNEMLYQGEDRKQRLTATNIEISQSPAKVVVKGSGNTAQTNRLLNFLERFFYYFRNPSNNYVQTAYQQCLKRVPQIVVSETDTQKGSKKIKILKDADPRTFNYKATKKFDPYSKKCQQNNQQPLVYTDEQFDKLKKKPHKDNIIRLRNKTRPETFLNYVCDHPIFQYPGFISKDQHPDGLCMPCCYRTNSRTNPSQKKYRKFQQCLKAEESIIGNISTTSTSISDRKPVRSYITNWKANEIEAGRFSKIPYQLADLLNVNDECKMPNNLLVSGSICFLIPGFQQDVNSFIKAVSICFNDTDTDLVKMVKESPDLFDIIENGEVKQRFTTLDNFIEYLNNNIETISDIYTKDLLSVKYNVHIAIFNYDIETEDLTITCSPKLDAINNQDTIIIIKTPKSDFTTFYYPVWKVSLSNEKKTFSPNSRTSNILSNLYQALCSDIILQQQAGIMFDAKFLAQNAKITGQILKKSTPQYLIVNNAFSIPVNINSFKLPNVPVVKEPVLGTVKDISAFLQELDVGITVNEDMRVINDKNQIIGYFLNTKYFVPTKPEKVKNILPNDYKLPNISSSKRDIQIPHKKLAEEDTKLRKEYQNYVREITLKLNTEKNAIIRNKLKTLGNDYKKDISIIEKLDISEEDRQELEQLLFDSYANPKLKFVNLINKNRFNFDNITKNKLTKAIENKNKKEIDNIISNLNVKGSNEFKTRVVQELLLNEYQRFNILYNTEVIIPSKINKDELLFVS